MSKEWISSPETGENTEKTQKELQWELSRTGWNFEDERREKEIFELKDPFIKILGELSEDIEKGNIQFLIGDDTSGRVPTLILRRCIAKLYEDKNFQAPRTFFMNGPGGGATMNEEQTEERVGQIIAHFKEKFSEVNSDSKTLIVTEAIFSGVSLLPLCEACKRMGIPVEVVSVGIVRNYDVKNNNLGIKIHYGMTSTPSIYKKPAFAGVHKAITDTFDVLGNREPAPLISESNKKRFPKHSQIERQRWLNEIRREIIVLSEEIVDEYKKIKLKDALA